MNEEQLKRIEQSLFRIRLALFVIAGLFVTIFVTVLLIPLFLGHSFSEYVTILSDTRTTLDRVEKTLNNVDAELSEVKKTVRQAKDTTDKAESAIQNTPSNIIKSIPVVNWFAN